MANTAAHTDLVAYFGYGSLVNKHTLRTRYVDSFPATLSGYRRHWQARTKTLAESVALLSIHAEPACDIKGMIVVDLIDNLPAVDEREAGYTRHAISAAQLQIDSSVSLPEHLYVYIANEPESTEPDQGALLQLSLIHI